MAQVKDSESMSKIVNEAMDASPTKLKSIKLHLPRENIIIPVIPLMWVESKPKGNSRFIAVAGGRGRWPVAGGRWPVAGGRWLVAGGRWPVAGGRRPVAGSRWPVAGSR